MYQYIDILITKININIPCSLKETIVLTAYLEAEILGILLHSPSDTHKII